MNADHDREPEEKKRPNANYRLSKTNDTPRPEEITYHYNRDRRLEKAPQAVQDLYYKKEEPPRRLKLFRSAPAGGKFQIVLMVFILLICLMALIITLVGRDGNTHEFAGNRISVRALRPDPDYTAFILLDKAAVVSRRGLFNFRPPPPAHTGIVHIEVAPADDPGQTPLLGNVFFHTIHFTEASPEFFFFTVPFDANELDIVLSTDADVLSLRIRVE